MSKVYRVGIVGLSGIAQNEPEIPPAPFDAGQTNGYGSHTTALSRLENIEIVGACDLVPELRDKFEKTWKSRWPNVCLYDDYTKMLKDGNLDIVTVATGDNVHTKLAIWAAESRVKAVFCEKPLATSLDEADQIIQSCKDNNVVLVVDHTRRWMPIFHQIREAIRSGSIGKLTKIILTQGGARAMLFRNGTHMIDLIGFFAESEPVKVWAKLEEGFDDWDRYKGDGGKKPENDPSATGFIQFKNDIQALYFADKNSYPGLSLQLYGNKGKINTNGNTTTMTINEGGKNGVDRTETIEAESCTIQGITAAYTEIISLIEHGGEGVSMGIEARKTVQIMMGFLNSNHSGSVLIDV